MLRLPANLRKELKKTIGPLFTGSEEEIFQGLRSLVDEINPPMLIAVGDVTAKNLVLWGFNPDILIVDGRVERKNVRPLLVEGFRSVKVYNPVGCISDEAWKAIEEAIQGREKTLILVEGEEDLLSLVAIILAPENSIVAYGLFGRGLTAVIVNSESKERCWNVISSMERIENEF